jgi:hypothetical protein
MVGLFAVLILVVSFAIGWTVIVVAVEGDAPGCGVGVGHGGPGGSRTRRSGGAEDAGAGLDAVATLGDLRWIGWLPSAGRGGRTPPDAGQVPLTQAAKNGSDTRNGLPGASSPSLNGPPGPSSSMTSPTMEPAKT